MRLARISFAFLLLTLTGCSAFAPTGADHREGDVFLLRDDVDDALQSEYGPTPFAMFCEAVSGDQRAAVYWPWLPRSKDPSRIDDDVFALLFERDGRRWRRVAGPFKTSGSDREKLFAIIGRPEQLDVQRPAGVPAEQLSGYMRQHLERLRAIYERSAIAEAMLTAESLARLFSDDLTCWEDSVSETALFPRTTQRYDYHMDNFEPRGSTATASFEVQVRTRSDGHDLTGVAEFKQDRRGWVLSGSKLTSAVRRSVSPTHSPE